MQGHLAISFLLLASACDASMYSTSRSPESPETVSADAAKWRHAVGVVGTRATAETRKAMLAGTEKCKSTPEAVSKKDLDAFGKLQLKFMSEAGEAIEAYIAKHPDPTAIHGRLQSYQQSDGGLYRELYTVCRAALTEHTLHPKPFKTEVKDGRTSEHYAALDLVVAWDSDQELHFFGPQGSALAMARISKNGCTTVRTCPSGRCKPMIHFGDVYCSLEILNEDSRIVEGKVVSNVVTGHYRLLRPDGWKEVVSPKDRADEEMKSKGWGDTP